MKRETKLGLVVASSFVALTTVVVMARMKPSQEPPPQPAAQAKPASKPPDPPPTRPSEPAGQPRQLPAELQQTRFDREAPPGGEGTGRASDLMAKPLPSGPGRAVPGGLNSPEPFDNLTPLEMPGKQLVQNKPGDPPAAVPAAGKPLPPPAPKDMPLPLPGGPVPQELGPGPAPKPAGVPVGVKPMSGGDPPGMPLPGAPAPGAAPSAPPVPGGPAPLPAPGGPLPTPKDQKGGLEPIDVKPGGPTPLPLPGGPAPLPGGPAPAPGGMPPLPGGGPTPLPGGPAPAPGGVTPLHGGPTPAPGGPAPAPGGVMPLPGGPSPLPGGLAPAPGGPAPLPGGPAPLPGGVTPLPGGPSPLPAGPTPLPGGPAPAPGGMPPLPGGSPTPLPGGVTPLPGGPAPLPLPGGPAPLPGESSMPGVPGAPIPKGVEPAPKGGEPKPVPLNKPADPEKRSGLSGDNRDEGTLARGKIEDGSTGAMNVAQVDLKGQPLPAVGAAPAGGSPLDPMPAPAKRPGPGAPVEEGATKYDVRTYRCKAEDTSFKVLSYRFYMSERYERALLFYNRTHPLVAEGVLIDPPRLKEGTTVFIPPLEILEQRHADVIPGLPVQRSASEAPSSRRGAPAGPEETRSVPVAVTPRPGAGPAPVNAVVRANAPASGEPKSYRVARGGEPMWQIAQRALGDARRWNEIYRLNPHLEPELPLREGTTVLLPADARIQ